MKQYHAKQGAALSTRGFYTILALCGLIIAVSAWVLWSNLRDEPQTELAASAPIIAPVEPAPDLTADRPVEAASAPAEEDAAAVSAPEETEPAVSAAATPSADTSVTVAAPVYVRPVTGEIIMPFSGDELLFQPTLGDWRVHSGTDFAAEAGEPVLALTDGTVADVYDDALYGTCVSVSHPAELMTTYRGLTDVRVIAGQAVTAGEALGAVAETIDAEAALGSHLHVEAARAGTPVDVSELLGEREE